MANPDAPKDAAPSKTAVQPVVAKKGKPADDDGGIEAKSGGVPPQQKMLPTGLSRAVVLASILASLTVLAASLLADRYDLVSAPNSPNSSTYRIDRLTGGVKFCSPQSCTDVDTASK